MDAAPGPPAAAGPLVGLRVLDVATLFAGPLLAMFLGDFGADVIKIEHPRGDPVRLHGPTKDGVGLWWKLIGRNKRAITLDLGCPAGADLFRRLCDTADVVVENFRPGTLERWGLAPEALLARRPGLVIVRTTGFGQTGPYARRPGFGTLAESLSGFAHMTGEADGPPTLPPLALADGIAAQAGALAALLALYHRDARGGAGQVVDLSLIEPILLLLGAQPTVYDQLGIVPGRLGNRSASNAPRNTYRTRDGKWVAISTSAQSVAERVMRLVGRADLIEEPWFARGADRARHADLLDEAVGGWIARHDLDAVMGAFEAAEAAIAPVYDVADVMRDPQYRALEAIVALPDEDLGTVRMQNLLFRMLGTPGRVRFGGRRLGQDNQAVYGELGVSPARLRELRAEGVV